ncbi:MAG TPA: phage Gp37/Gp68 family protein [Candidatus Binatia bacterium]|nr:phage Gp37/Gp68 family protein [Candidatus Binatia bacterium]
MAERSEIEWTNATWNPARGCTKVSPGCKHCYAESFAERFRGVPGHAYEHGFDLRLVPSALDLPLKWRTGRLVFVNSMSDLFHEDIPDDYITRVFDVIRRASQHQFQVLTKRAERMEQFTARLDVPSNVWLGVSVESEDFKWRVDHLRRVRARIRFLSVEPLLAALGRLNLRGIHWVIVGGESGPGSRRMEAKWVRSIRAQCRAARVPFFFKQWGGVQKKKTGRLLDGRTYDEMPAITRTNGAPKRPEQRRLLIG